MKSEDVKPSILAAMAASTAPPPYIHPEKAPRSKAKGRPWSEHRARRRARKRHRAAERAKFRRRG